MANSYIRIYDKPVQDEEPATWLGLSASPAHDFKESQERIAAYFTEQGYSITELDLTDKETRQKIASVGGFGTAFSEIKPPIDEERYKEFGAFFASIVDPGDDTTFFMDNRRHPFPTTYVSARKNLISSWI